MGITSGKFIFAVARQRWHWPLSKALGLLCLFLSIDLAFFGANAAKFVHGGWIPIVVAAGVFALMTTWERGRATLQRMIVASTMTDLFLEDIKRVQPYRVNGTAVFMTQNPDVPPVLLHYFKHNKVLHKQVLLLSVRTEDVPA